MFTSEVYCQKLSKADVKLFELAVFDNRIAMFYIESLLKEILEDEDNIAFLKNYRYDTSSVKSDIKCLKFRLRSFYKTMETCVFRDNDFNSLYYNSVFHLEIVVLLGYSLPNIMSYLK